MRKDYDDAEDEAVQNLCERLYDEGFVEVEVSYYGYGDSGQVETIEPIPEDEEDKTLLSMLDNGRITRDSNRDLWDEICEVVLRLLPGGWEINEGSSGTMTFHCEEGKAHLKHGQFVKDKKWSTREFGE